MELKLLSWMVLTAVALRGNTLPMPDQFTRGLDWLSRYGYLPPPDPRTGKLQTMEGIEQALRVMQRFGGIRETGVLDSDTLRLMATPRCSLPDIVGSEDMLRRRKRRKRYSLTGLQWEKTDLTWSIHSYPSPSVSNSLDPGLVDNLLIRALKAWSDVTPLQFRRVQSDSEGDIRVSFTRLLHDDGYPFDGRGGTLAHAFFPGSGQIAGDTHFDDDEIWSFGGAGTSTDLFTVAVHEFGHALGLSHSSSDPSIMKPYYQGPVKDISNYRLPLDDRQAIQQIYGVKEGRPSPPVGGSDIPHLPSPPPPRPTQLADPSIPDRCEGGFDAVANIRGEVFFFKGVHFWRTKRDGSLISLHPALIENFWIGLPPGTNKIDAVYERKSDSCIIFFIGSRYWVFKDTEVMEGYPRPLADWGLQTSEGKPVDRVDAAFIWAHNGKTYLFSGGQFWRFDDSRESMQVTRQPEAGYPRDSSLWKGVPAYPDDIISWKEGNAYFFKDNLYWVLKRGGMDQDDVAPKSIAVEWLRCPAPAPTRSPARPYPRDCSCALNRSPALPKSSFPFLLAVALISSLLSQWSHCTLF